MEPLRLSGGTIGGIVIGVCAGLLLILIGAFLWYRNRRPKPTPTKDSQSAIDLGAGIGTFHTPTLPATVERYQPLLVAGSTTTNLLQPHSGATPTVSPAHSSSTTSHTDSRSRLVLHNPNPATRDTSGPVQEGAPAPENAGLYPTSVHVGTSAKPTSHPVTDLTFCCTLSWRRVRYRNPSSRAHGFVQTLQDWRRYQKTIFETCGCE